jgi:hypothetical protein
MTQKTKARLYAGAAAFSFGALIVAMGAPVKWY